MITIKLTIVTDTGSSKVSYFGTSFSLFSLFSLLSLFNCLLSFCGNLSLL